MGTLYVVATPIGNLEDLSPRARRILASVDVIASEDTRHTGQMLKRLGIERRQLSYHAFNEQSRLENLIARLADGDVALVSNAGTPGISDPGALLVRAAAEAGFPVLPIPGPSALTAAMSVSGFADGPAVFLGFLPRNAGERTALLSRSLRTGFSVFFYESPRRVLHTIQEIAKIAPQREVVIFRELTKLHEETMRDAAESLATTLPARTAMRGEIVVGVAGSMAESLPLGAERTLLVERLESGMSVSDAAREVAALSGMTKSEVYSLALQIRSGEHPDAAQPD